MKHMDMNRFVLIRVEIEYKTKVFKYLRHVINSIFYSAANLSIISEKCKKKAEIFQVHPL